MFSKRSSFISSILAALVVAVLAVGAAGCVPGPGSATPTTSAPAAVTVSSNAFADGRLLGKLMVQVLRYNGVGVNDLTGSGSEQGALRQALESGQIDLYPEFTGNGSYKFNEATNAAWKDLEKGWARVNELDKPNNVVWLRPAPFSIWPTIAVTRKFATEKGLKTLDDFAAYVKSGGTVKLTCPSVMASTPELLPTLQQAYGFTLTKDQLVLVSGGIVLDGEVAVSRGTNGINAVMADPTDGGLYAFGLVALPDNRHVNLVFAPAPSIRQPVLTANPKIATILEPVFQSLTLEIFQKLNAQFTLDGKSAETVASQYLKDVGFVK